MNTQKPGLLPQLIARLSDGKITPSEIEQLNALLLADPIALEAYLDHMELDAMLEREFGGRASSQQPVVPRKAQPMAWRNIAVGALAAAVLLVVGFFLADSLRRQDSPLVPDQHRVAHVASDYLRVTQADGPVQIKKPDGSLLDVVVGSKLLAGEMLQVKDGAVVLVYEDGTSFRLFGPATLVVGGSERGKRLELRHGMLHADVTRQPIGQPLVIGTPNATVRVLGTRFELLADDQSGTRLDLESGRVELLRDGEAAVAVEPNSIAMAPATDEPIKIMPRPKMIIAEKREARCLGQGLWSFDFSKDGRAVVASSNLGAFYWHDDDVTETIRALPDLKREGVNYLGSAGPLVAFEQKNPHRVVLWNTATRTPLRFVDELEKLPSAVMRRSTDNKRLPLLRDFEVFSPRGDWVASYARIGDGDEVRIYDLTRQQSKVIFRPKTFMMCFRVSPDGSMLAMGEFRHGPVDLVCAAIELIAPLTGERIALLPALERHEKKRKGIVPIGLAFSANGQHLVAGLNSEVQVWNVTKAERIARIKDVGIDERVLAVSNDGQTIAAAASGSRRVQLWDIAHSGDSTAIDFDDPVRALKFSPDGQRLVAIVGHNRLVMMQVARRSGF